jgi:hypothetical protein
VNNGTESKNETLKTLADKHLLASTVVWVYAEPTPVRQMTVLQLAEGVRAGSIPDNASVSADNQASWLWARDVISACPEPLPIRSVPVAILAVAVPAALVLLHAKVFGAPGCGLLMALAVAGVAIAMVVTLVDGLRTRRPRELLPRWVIVTAATVVLIAETSAVWSATTWRAYEKRVNAVLVVDVECGARSLTPDEIAWVRQNDDWYRDSGVLESRDSVYAAQITRCERAKTRRDHEAACAQSAAAVESRKPSDAQSGELSLEDVALLKRVAERTLQVADLGRFDSLPCADSGSNQRIRSAFIGAARELGGEWLGAAAPMELQTAIKAAKLTQAATVALRNRVDENVATALKAAADIEALNHAVADCDVAVDLLGDDSPKCTHLRQVRDALTARNEVIQKAKEVRCDAARKALERCQTRCEASAPTDDLGLPDFDKGSDCDERCERAISLSSCE